MGENNYSMDAESRCLPFPNRITVELTNHCNLSCRMCPRKNMRGERGYMPLPLYKKIIDEMSRHLPVALVPFFRGESLLHPDFLQMLSYAKDRGVGPIQLTTNGKLLNSEIIKYLVDLNLDFISTSLDSVNPKIYEEVRGGADLQKVMNSIEDLLVYREQKGNNLPEIQVSMVKTCETESELQAFVAHWQRRVDRVRVYEEHSQDGHFGSFKQVNDISLDCRKPCLKPFQEMVIYWNGNVALCNHDWDRSSSIGNVIERTIQEIWIHDKYQEIRENHHLLNSSLETVCLHCDHWQTFYTAQKYIGALYE